MADRGVVRPPYWVVQRLIATITASPTWTTFHGELALRGVDPLGWPLHVFCDAAYAWLTKGADKKEQARFDAELTTPPPSVDLSTLPEWQDTAMDAGFAGAFDQFNQ